VATTAKVYGLALQSMLNAEINFSSDTIKAMLCTSSYVPDQDLHRYKSSVTNEITGTGYTAGGVTLTSKTVTYDAPSNTLTLDCADPSWAAATITARYLVIYKSTGTDSTSPLLVFVDFGTDISSTGGTFSYTVPATGIAQVTAA
jgi:hypothetical protein